MINGIFALITTILMSIFCINSLTLRGNYIKRTFLDMPINLVKKSLVVDTTNEANLDIYFISESLETDVKNYISLNLKDMITSYKISFTYFNYLENGRLDFNVNNKPENVQIRFNCVYFQDNKLDEHLVFSAKLI